MLSWKEHRLVVAQVASIGVQLDRQGKKTIRDNRRYVKCLLETLLYCAQQGIALRGHQETNLEDSSMRLMVLQSRHDDVQ